MQANTDSNNLNAVNCGQEFAQLRQRIYFAPEEQLNYVQDCLGILAQTGYSSEFLMNLWRKVNTNAFELAVVEDNYDEALARTHVLLHAMDHKAGCPVTLGQGCLRNKYSHVFSWSDYLESDAVAVFEKRYSGRP